jgi:hypothetical protein
MGNLVAIAPGDLCTKSKEIWKGKPLGEVVEPVVEEIMSIRRFGL